MAGWNGSGSFSLPYSWVADDAAGIPITASRFDTQEATISVQGFGNTLTRDGQGQPSASLPMAGHKHTGAAVASGTGEYLVYQQLVGSGSLNLSAATITLTGTANVFGILAGHAGLVMTGGAQIATGNVNVDLGSVIQTTGNAPASAAAAGVTGQIGWDATHFYLCVSANTWVRNSMTTW